MLATAVAATVAIMAIYIELATAPPTVIELDEPPVAEPLLRQVFLREKRNYIVEQLAKRLKKDPSVATAEIAIELNRSASVEAILTRLELASEPDLVEREALVIAGELIRRDLAAAGVSILPPNFTQHCSVLAGASAEIQQLAIERVKKRITVAAAAFANLREQN